MAFTISLRYDAVVQKIFGVGMNYTLTMKFILAMIIMMNPLGSLSIFLDLTNRYSRAKQRRTAVKSGFAMALIMVISIWAGAQVLDFMGITISSFRVVGGIILLLVGLSMLQSQESPLNHTPADDVAAEERPSIAVVPLALPIIIGPGAISTLVLASNDSGSIEHRVWLSIICLFLALSMTVILYYGNYIGKFVGESVMKLVTRIMGMIIMAIAVGMLANGLVGLFPVLGKVG